MTDGLALLNKLTRDQYFTNEASLDAKSVVVLIYKKKRRPSLTFPFSEFLPSHFPFWGKFLLGQLTSGLASKLDRKSLCDQWSV